MHHSGTPPGAHAQHRFHDPPWPTTSSKTQTTRFVMTERHGHETSTMAPLKAVATILCILCIASAAASQDLAADTRALVVFQTTLDPTGTKLKWSNATSPCSWNGVVCSGDRVTQIHLPGEGLTGVIPANSLSSLSELRVVSLRNNRLTGLFPGELGRCNRVRALYLGGNDFYGNVPDLSGFWPRLMRFSVEYNRFNGSIPASIGLFSHLYLLNLRNNFFSGTIPPFDLANLTLFDVSNNNLSGPLPSTLTRFGPASFLGNPGLCGDPLPSVCTSSPPNPLAPSPSPSPFAPQPSKTSRHSRHLLSAAAITAIVVGSVALLVVLTICLFLCCWRHRRRSRSAARGGGAPVTAAAAAAAAGGGREKKGKGVVEDPLGEDYSSSAPGELERKKLVFFEGKKYSFDLEDLLRASAEVLGKGSVGTAYKAVLEDGTVMAVKRLKDVTLGRKEFEAQIEGVGKMQHRNLVPLRAYYFSKEEKLLVYEYMPVGSLSALLHGNRGSNRKSLDWVSRVRIALGVARGLEYLHAQGVGPRFVHGNIKSCNVLLHRDLEACISDFGLTQLLNSASAASRVVGYRAPEITETRKVTQKSDVYSFGVLLLELLTGKAPHQVTPNDEGIDLPQWVQSVVREEWTAEVFDLELMRYHDIEEEMVSMLQLAMQCVDMAPERRPSMRDLLPSLEDVHTFSSAEGTTTGGDDDEAEKESKGGGGGSDEKEQEDKESSLETTPEERNPSEHERGVK